MYILVDAVTNKIVGSAVNALSEEQCSKNGQKIYNIPDDEYSHSMIGAKLENFQKIKE